MQQDSSQLEKSMQNRHDSVSLFSEIDLSKASSLPSTNDFEGYLFKRTSKGFKTWNRRWFYLHDKKLLYVYVKSFCLNSI